MGQGPGEARRDVEAARDRLGDTVEALAYRANAPRRAKDELSGRWQRFTARFKRRSGGAHGSS